jgi:hypothetical protein
MVYREMVQSEAEKIKMIDGTCYIKNAWRMVDGTLQLVEINWTDYEHIFNNRYYFFEKKRKLWIRKKVVETMYLG